MPRNVVILIPSRFQSSRFPGKPLATIAGISMIQRVYRNCHEGGIETYVVTDSSEIEQHVLSFQGKVLRVDDNVPSGTERIALAYDRFLRQTDVELIINVQGDEPLLTGGDLKKLVAFHQQHSHFDITTLLRPRISGEADFSNPNVVKAVFCKENGKCLYFSRASIPFERDQEEEYQWHQHIGVYCYKPLALQFFREQKKVSRLENLEKLEQLRALESGLSIGAIETSTQLVGVDRPEDIQKVEEALRKS